MLALHLANLRYPRSFFRAPLLRNLTHSHGPLAPNSQRQIEIDCASKHNRSLSFKVRPHQSWGFDFDRLTSGTNNNVQLDDLEIQLEHNRTMVFNLTWLRDSCHCDRCTHQYSRQRLFTPKDFARDKFCVSYIKLASEQNKLQVEWANGHQSSYSLDWLAYIDELYRARDSQLVLDGFSSSIKYRFPHDDFYSPTSNRQIQARLWNVSEIIDQLEPVNYRDLVDGFVFHSETTHINANKLSEMTQKRYKSMLSLSKQLITFGLAKIVDVPTERDHVLKVARSLAYERPTGYGTVFDVVVEPSEEINLAYSSQEFDLHSDLTYREMSPGVQMLHCIKNSVDGGDSYFSDTFRAAQILRDTQPSLFEVLVKFPATFVVRDPYRNLKFRRQQPVLSLDYQGKFGDVYYSPFMLPPIGHLNDVKLFYLAMDKLTQLLQSKENKLVVKMNPGDLFIFHNRRVLHGRSSYNPQTSNRFLQGCYIDWDEIECLHEKLLSHQDQH